MGGEDEEGRGVGGRGRGGGGRPWKPPLQTLGSAFRALSVLPRHLLMTQWSLVFFLPPGGALPALEFPSHLERCPVPEEAEAGGRLGRVREEPHARALPDSWGSLRAKEPTLYYPPRRHKCGAGPLKKA